MIKVRPIKPGEGSALLSMVRALLKAVAALAIEKNHPSIYWLMMDWNMAASTLYKSVGAEIEPGTSFCRIHGAALAALAA